MNRSATSHQQLKCSFYIRRVAALPVALRPLATLRWRNGEY
jgi:hypothetical protein